MIDFETAGIPRSSAVSAASLGQELYSAPLTAFSAPSPITWDQKTGDRLVELLRLPKNWDGHRAARVSHSIVDYACNLLPRLVISGIPAPFIAPLPFGGLQLEWHRKDYDLEIEIRAPGKLYVYFREITTGTEWERDLWDDLTELAPKLDLIRD